MELKKPIAQKWNWNIQKSEALDLLACESLILEFLHQWVWYWDEVKPITEQSLFDFWKFIEEKKDKLWVEDWEVVD